VQVPRLRQLLRGQQVLTPTPTLPRERGREITRHNDHLFANHSLELRPSNATLYAYACDLSESQPMKETTSVGSRTPGPQGPE